MRLAAVHGVFQQVPSTCTVNRHKRSFYDVKFTDPLFEFLAKDQDFVTILHLCYSFDNILCKVALGIFTIEVLK